MIALAGATGTLGRQILLALQEKNHPAEELTLFASPRSEGEELDYDGETLAVEPVAWQGIDTVLVAAPIAAAKGIAEVALKAGVRVIDFSGAFRTDAGVPLVAPGVNAAPQGARLVSVAGPGGLALATVLARLPPTAFVDVTALYGAASRGAAGVKRLEHETADLLAGRETESHDPFAHRLAFNVIPQVGAFAKGEHPQSAEELAVALDVSRVLQPSPALRVTALHVPTFHGLTLTVHAQLLAPVELEPVRAALKASPRIKVLDAPAEGVYPMPMLATSDDAVHVGRLRAVGNHLWLIVAVDNTGLVARAGITLL